MSSLYTTAICGFEKLASQCICFILIYSFYSQKHIAGKIQFYIVIPFKKALKVTHDTSDGKICMKINKVRFTKPFNVIDCLF